MLWLLRLRLGELEEQLLLNTEEDRELHDEVEATLTEDELELLLLLLVRALELPLLEDQEEYP